METALKRDRGIAILGLCFERGIGKTEENLSRLAAALEDAEIRPLPRPLPWRPSAPPCPRNRWGAASGTRSQQIFAASSPSQRNSGW